MKINRLVLASQSPFRKALLDSTGISYECAVSNVDEKSIIHRDPRCQSLERALAKAKAVALKFPDAMVIGADQVLSFEDRLLDKVESPQEATSVLSELSGKTHVLYSAFCCLTASEVYHEQVVTVAMQMRHLSAQEIAAYVATGEWQGCVGCYRYESRGIHLMQEIRGSHSAIIGLPLLELLAAFRSLGMDPLLAPCGPWHLRKALP